MGRKSEHRSVLLRLLVGTPALLVAIAALALPATGLWLRVLFAVTGAALFGWSLPRNRLEGTDVYLFARGGPKYPTPSDFEKVRDRCPNCGRPTFQKGRVAGDCLVCGFNPAADPRGGGREVQPERAALVRLYDEISTVPNNQVREVWDRILEVERGLERRSARSMRGSTA